MRLLTAKEVADIIGCSEKTIYSWAETGYTEIPAIKMGSGRKSLLRFDADEIHKWIQLWKDRTSKRYNGNNAETVASARKGGLN
jgi:excisionase family DNA binding protein